MPKELDPVEVDEYLSELVKKYPEDLQKKIKDWILHPYSESDFPTLFEEAKSDHLHFQIHGLIGIRNLLRQDDPPIQTVIDNGIVPYVFKFMKLQEQPLLQCEAAWILANLTSGTSQQTKYVVDQGGIDLFCKLLHSEYSKVAEQAMWGLSNLSSESEIYRDQILEQGAMEKLLQFVQSSQKQEKLEDGVWVISNLCRGNPRPKIELVEAAGPVLCSLITKIDKNEEDAAWALAILAEGNRDDRMIIPTDALPEILSHLRNRKENITPYMRFFQRILAFTESQGNILVNLPDFIPMLFELLEQTKEVTVKREIYDVFADITMNVERKNLLFATPEWLNKLTIDVFLSTKVMWSREGIEIFTNAAQGCTAKQAIMLFEFGVLKFFATLLINNQIKEDSLLISTILDGIENMLKRAPKGTDNNNNPFFTFIEKEPGFSDLKDLQRHPKAIVCWKARKILKDFCLDEDIFTIEEWEKNSPTVQEELLKFISAIKSDDKVQQLQGTIGIRKILWKRGGIEEDLNIIPQLLELTKREGESELQLEATRVLRYLTGESESGDQIQIIAENEGISQFLTLLKHSNEAIAIQAVWALGNMALAADYYRDEILQEDGAKTIVEILRKTSSKTLLDHGIWSLCNLIKEEPRPGFEEVKDVLPFVISILQTETEEEILTNAAWTLVHFSKYHEANDIVMPIVVIPVILKHFETDYDSLLSACLSIIGNIAARDENEPAMVMRLIEMIPRLYKLLDHKSSRIRKVVCGTLSNFTIGKPEKIEHFLKNTHSLQKLIEITKTDELKVAIEALGALLNATSSCNYQQLMQLSGNGVLDLFIECLNRPCEEEEERLFIKLALQGILDSLKKGSEAEEKGQPNPFPQILLAKGVAPVLEKLKNHPSGNISFKAETVLESLLQH